MAREAIRICGDRGCVIGLDLSENMLAIARRALGIGTVRARGEELPIASESMDFVSMGYALRHMADLGRAFAEFHRVLRPGGTLLILEIGRPPGAPVRALARLYLGRIVPALCRVRGSGTEAGRLMQYYWDTIEACVAPSVILDALACAGFDGGVPDVVGPVPGVFGAQADELNAPAQRPGAASDHMEIDRAFCFGHSAGPAGRA